MSVRSAGLLLPITALPGRFAVGDLGPGARRFLDFLAAGRQRLWQLLPVGITTEVHGNSPYSSLSAFAIDPLLLSPEDLVEAGLLAARDLPTGTARGARVRYEHAREQKSALLDRAVTRFRRGGPRRRSELERFREENTWLGDVALFLALRDAAKGAAWTDWPDALRDRLPRALAAARRRHQAEVERHEILQLLAHRQWTRLREAARAHGVQLLGDMPLYVAHDSADVWAHPDLFALDARGAPEVLAGVPPDYFSDTGQLWANPVYRWEVHAETGYAWWCARVDRALAMFDRVRLDHFRGLDAYWAVPADAATAQEGRWVGGPGAHLLEALVRRHPGLPIVAEDLGVIDASVRELKDRFGLPGMRILQFAFGGNAADSEHAPHHYTRDCVVFTGTHDNNTTRGWFDEEADRDTRRRITRYAGRRVTAANVADVMIQLAFASVANDAIVPLQDVLGLGAAARTNRPGTPRGHWSWRAGARALADAHAVKLSDLAATYGR